MTTPGASPNSVSNRTFDPSQLDFPETRMKPADSIGTAEHHMASLIKGSLGGKDMLLINSEHPRLLHIVKNEQRRYHEAVAEVVKNKIFECLLADMAVAVVVQTTQYRAYCPVEAMHDRVLTPEVLSACLLTLLQNTTRLSSILLGVQRSNKVSVEVKDSPPATKPVEKRAPLPAAKALPTKFAANRELQKAIKNGAKL